MDRLAETDQVTSVRHVGHVGAERRRRRCTWFSLPDTPTTAIAALPLAESVRGLAGPEVRPSFERARASSARARARSTGLSPERLKKTISAGRARPEGMHFGGYPVSSSLLPDSVWPASSRVRWGQASAGEINRSDPFRTHAGARSQGPGSVASSCDGVMDHGDLRSLPGGGGHSSARGRGRIATMTPYRSHSYPPASW